MAEKAWLNHIQNFVGIVVTIAAGVSAWKLNSAESLLKESDRQLQLAESTRKEAEESRAERESREKKQLVVYEAVVKSLEKGDINQQRVSKALVTAMLENPLRTDLLQVLGDSTSPQIKKEVARTLSQENTFKDEEQQLITSSVRKKEPTILAGWDFDIFWCERSGESAKTQAMQIQHALSLQQTQNANGDKGRIRVRMLPDSINLQPGFRISGYAIRYNKGEEPQTEKLKTIADNALGLKDAFTPSISHQVTRWYLSAYVCTGSI